MEKEEVLTSVTKETRESMGFGLTMPDLEQVYMG